MRIKVLGMALALVAIPAAAHAMTVAVFLQKAEALDRRGATALFSSDFRLLKAEAKAAGEALKAERLAARQAGRRPAFCPPEGAARMTADELLAYLRSIPPAQRPRLQLRDAMRSMLARRYPCRS